MQLPAATAGSDPAEGPEAPWSPEAWEGEWRRSIARVVVPVRAAALVVLLVGTAIGAGDEAGADVVAAALVALSAGLGVVAVIRPASRLAARAGWLVGLDWAAATTVAFNHAQAGENPVFVVWTPVIVEAAMYWRALGGIAGGGVAAGLVVVWSYVRDARFDIGVDAGTLVFRVASLVALGWLVGWVLSRIDEIQRSQRDQALRFDTMHRFALEASRLDMPDAARRIVDMILGLGYERVAVLFVNTADRRLDVVALGGYRPRTDGYEPVALDRGVSGRCARTGEVQLVADVMLDADYVERDPDTRSELAVPLAIGDRVVGVVDIASTRPDRFTETDVRFLRTFAGQLAQALEAARLGARERETIEELRRLNQLKDEFVAVASHELRTPLTSLRGYARTLASRTLPEEQVQEFIAGINRQADRLARLVEDLLAVSRIEGGRAEPVMEVVNLRTHVDEVLAEAAAAGGGVLRNEVAPGTFVVGDPSFLRRILVNLVANGARYSGAGTVAVRSARAGGDVLVSVVDQGVGIAPADQERIFEKFTVLPRAGGSPGGTGLGLFIVKGLVEAMGGRVEVDSEPGRGTTMTFVLRAPPAGAVP